MKQKHEKESHNDNKLRKRLHQNHSLKNGAKFTWRKRKEMSKPQNEKKLLKQLEEFRNSTTKSNLHDDTIGETISEKKRNPYKLTIALPGSILDNAQSQELRTYLAGQIARASAVFCVNEIVVFDEKALLTQSDITAFEEGKLPPDKADECNFDLVRILQFLECPQYLRKSLFPLQKQLKFAGLLNPLDCPHHFRSNELDNRYREAVVLDKPTKESGSSFCDAGLEKVGGEGNPRHWKMHLLMQDVQVDLGLKAGIRVTLKLKSTDTSSRKLFANVVSPTEPTEKTGAYWGYSVRLARSLSSIFDENIYDLTIGTSERGKAIETVTLPDFKHALLVFGGLNGLESCVEADGTLNARIPSDLFDFYVNSVPNQGSRTIRTEEAILITISAIRCKLDANLDK